MTKKQQVHNLIRKKLTGQPYLRKWYFKMLKGINWYIYSDCPEGVKERYDRWLEIRDEDIREFRGLCYGNAELTYKRRKNRWKYWTDENGNDFFYNDIMLNDNNETIESLAWLLLHELGHAYIRLNDDRDNPMKIFNWLNGANQDNVKRRYNKPYWELYLTNDDVHEERPEELFCNNIATSIIDKQLCRHWWRKNRYPELIKNV